MNYLEIEIDGVKRGWKFNNLAYVTFIKKVAGKDYLSAAPYAMFYAGLVANCFVKEVEEDFDFEKSCDWADKIAESHPEIPVKMSKIFTDSLQFKKLIEEVKEKTEKKTVPKKNGSTKT